MLVAAHNRPNIIMTTYQTIFVLLFYIYILGFLYNSFHIKLAIDTIRGKRKFFYIKAKCHLWEEDGSFEFSNPDIFKEPCKTYLKNHPYEFECLVEELKTDIRPEERYYFVPVERNGQWNYSFRDKSRKSFCTFHIERNMVIEKKPISFSFRTFCLDQY